MRVHSVVLGLVAVASLGPSLAFAPAAEAPPRPFLRKVIQLDDAQLAAVEKGEVVTKLLPTTDKPEIAAFGVVKTAGTVDQLLALAKDVQKFRKVPQIPEMGRFSNPAKIEDLKGLTHPPDDIAALKKCKPGSCDVKLGTKGLEAVSKIDWSAADAEGRAVAIFNQAIIAYVTAYQQGGTDAMGNVLDKKDFAWVDALAGLRFRAPLGSRFALVGRGDVAGFGSKFTWNLEGDLAASLSEHWTAGAGWRHLHIDYDKGTGTDRKLFDAAYDGPRAWFAYA